MFLEHIKLIRMHPLKRYGCAGRKLFTRHHPDSLRKDSASVRVVQPSGWSFGAPGNEADDAAEPLQKTSNSLMVKIWLIEKMRCPYRWYLPDGIHTAAGCGRITEGRVVNYYEFREELPMTEWLGGEIRVERDEEGILCALWNGKRLNNKL